MGEELWEGGKAEVAGGNDSTSWGRVRRSSVSEEESGDLEMRGRDRGFDRFRSRPPSGKLILPDGIFILPDGIFILPNDKTRLPDGIFILQDGKTGLPEGSAGEPSEPGNRPFCFDPQEGG